MHETIKNKYNTFTYYIILIKILKCSGDIFSI